MICAYCQEREASDRYCSQRCRQQAWRLRRRAATQERHGQPMRFAYYDPPYLVGPGRRDQRSLARKLYHREDVDHVALIAGAVAAQWDGWALSCSEDSLRELLPLMPPQTRVCPWCHTEPPNARTEGLHRCVEYLLVVGGRQRAPGKRNFLVAATARGEELSLPGRKPSKFIAWLWDCLGAVPGDTLHDAFPGTGAVARGWAVLSLTTPAAHDRRPSAPSTAARSDAPSLPGTGDAASLIEDGDRLRLGTATQSQSAESDALEYLQSLGLDSLRNVRQVLNRIVQDKAYPNRASPLAAGDAA